MSEGGDDSAQDIHQPSNRVAHFWQKYYSIFAEEYSNNIWKYLLIISYNTVDYPNNPLLFWAASIRQKIQSASGQKISLYKILHTQGNSHTHILHLTQAPDTHNQGEQTAFNQRQISHMDNKAFELWIWITNTPLRAVRCQNMVSFHNLGALLGRLAPRCSDPHPAVRLAAISAVHTLLNIQLRYEGTPTSCPPRGPPAVVRTDSVTAVLV